MRTHLLQDDPLPWLLEPDLVNPAIRYFALRELLDCPQNEPEVREAKGEIMKSGPVPAILDVQASEGYWAKAGTGYSPKYRATTWQIILLVELGADPDDERVRKGCEYLLNHSLAPNAAFSVYQSLVPSGALHCLNGNLLYALLRLGYGNDPRVHSALNWQAQAIIGGEGIRYYKSGTTGPGFACGINLGQPCGWGAVKAMKALSAIQPEDRSPAVQRAINTGVEFLLSRDPAEADYPYTERVSSTWFKLGFPLSYWSDVLEVVAVLTNLGYGNDPRLANAIRFILGKQNAQGRWKLENSLNGKMWIDIERRGKPSKWVTLRVMRFLKQSARI
jgi:hypothetical protein